MTTTPFNYRYLLDHGARYGGRILDYGCGDGRMVSLGRDRGLDIWGADSFAGYYESTSEALRADIRDRVLKIAGGRADFPDAHFDVVVSNQVLEHVTEPEVSIADMCRLMRPGGVLMATFPVASTWYEGHVGLYFAHHFSKGSKLRDVYFRIARHCGFGLYYQDATPRDWARLSGNTLDEACFYYSRSRMMNAFEEIFRTPVDDMAVDYMRTRLGGRAAFLPDWFLRFIHRKRAGEIVKVHKG